MIFEDIYIVHCLSCQMQYICQFPTCRTCNHIELKFLLEWQNSNKNNFVFLCVCVLWYNIKLTCFLQFAFFLQQPTWRYWGEEKVDGAIFTVYLKKVRYHTPTKSVSVVSNNKSTCINYFDIYNPKLMSFCMISVKEPIPHFIFFIKLIFNQFKPCDMIKVNWKTVL